MPIRFLDAVRLHSLRYPLMQAQDYVKLAYQSEYGPGHMVEAPEAVLPALASEWAGADIDGVCPPPEPVGGGLCRFHLSGADYSPESARLLAGLFFKTAAGSRGSAAGLSEKLAAVRALDIPGMTAYLRHYEALGCPPVRHSEAYRRAYAPHYRLLSAPFAHFFPALLSVSRLFYSGKRAIVAIDGRCGSGKTSLSELISELFPCNVFHMDDFYLPVSARPENWQAIPAGNLDIARFYREVLSPCVNGEPVLYSAFDCAGGQYAAPREVPDRALTVIEGSGCQHPMLRDFYDLKIFLTCSEAEQLRRLALREGSRAAAFRSVWIPMEENYFKSCSVRDRCEFTLDTDAFFD